MTPKDPKTASDQNFLNTPKEPPAKDLFTQVSSKSIESCRRRSVLGIFEQRLQMTPRWPLTPNSWTPLLSPHLMIIISKYHENRSRHIREEAFFSNCGRIDRYTDRYTDRQRYAISSLHPIGAWAKNWIVLHRMWWLLYIFLNYISWQAMKGKSKFNDRCPGAGPKKFCPSLFLCILKLTDKKQLPYPKIKWINPTRPWMHPMLCSHTCRCLECNCTKIMHARYFCVFLLSIVNWSRLDAACA